MDKDCTRDVEIGGWKFLPIPRDRCNELRFHPPKWWFDSKGNGTPAISRENLGVDIFRRRPDPSSMMSTVLGIIPAGHF